MKNKSVAWGKTNAIGIKLKDGCLPITYNGGCLAKLPCTEAK